MRLAYLGTPAMAVAPLRALVEAGFDVAAVVTRVDKRRGRGSQLLPSAVKAAAVELGLPVHHRVDDLLDLGIDLAVVVAFGQIIKPHVLARIPMVNLHFSLLPRWRGAAPVERALLAGDEVTGVCLMDVDESLDTGALYECREVPIDGRRADELRAELVTIGTEMLVRRLRDGLGQPAPQVGEPTYADKVRPDELRLDWSRSPVELDRLVRLGGAWTTFRGRRLKVLSAAVVGDEPGDVLGGDRVGGLRLVRVQPEGKGAMDFADWARGAHPAAGERLGT
jgi:methionyl-tRNA formyltransferase